MEQPRKPREARIDLSNGQTITVGVMTWGHWCRTKERLIELLSSKTLEAALQQIGPDADLSAIGRWLQTDSFKLLPMLATELTRALDSLTDEVVAGCVREGLPEDLGAIDFARIRQAALEVNDFAALVEAEKNFLREVAGSVMRRIGALTADASRGGSDGNQSSPADTGGPRSASGASRPTKSSSTSG